MFAAKLKLLQSARDAVAENKAKLAQKVPGAALLIKSKPAELSSGPAEPEKPADVAQSPEAEAAPSKSNIASKIQNAVVANGSQLMQTVRDKARFRKPAIAKAVQGETLPLAGGVKSMGLLGKKKKDGKQDAATPENSQASPSRESPQPAATNTESAPEKTSISSSPFGVGLEALKSLASPQSEGAGSSPQVEAPKKEDPLSNSLMDIFTDDEETSEDLAALSKYLEDVDMGSLLAQAKMVASRLRSPGG